MIHETILSNNKRERTWTTFYGQIMKVENMSHQHISNILWYFDLVLGMGELYPMRLELINRFGGIQLPYHPMISFEREIKELVKKGYTSGNPDADIIVKGKWVGKIKYS